MTELPNSWTLRTLGEVASLEKGSTITAKTARPGTVPVVAGGKQPAYFHDQANRPANTITVSASGAYAGYVGFYREPIFASDCTTVNVFDDSDCLIDFLHYFMLSKQNEIYGMQRGSGMPHVYAKDIGLLEVPVPPIEDQKQIVRELDKHLTRVDIASRLVASQLGNLERLFDYLLDSVYWKNAEEFVQLNEFGDWVTGSTPSTQNPEYFGGSIPFVTPPEIKDSKEVTVTKRTLTVEGGKKVRLITDPSIHIVCIGTVGKIGFSTKVTSTNQQITSLVPAPSVDFSYALDLFSSKEATKRLREASSKSNMPMLAKGSLLKIEMPLPNIDQQRMRLDYAQKLKLKRHGMESHFRKAIQSLNDLKQSILYAAFTGQLNKETNGN